MPKTIINNATSEPSARSENLHFKGHINLFNTYIIAYPKTITNKKPKILKKMSLFLPIDKFILSEDEKANKKASPKNSINIAPIAKTAQSLLIIPRLVFERASKIKSPSLDI